MITVSHATIPDESVLTADEFKTAFRNHPAGVAVITANSSAGPVALTATSVVSVSAEPPLLSFSISAISSSTPVIRSASSVVIHLLDVEQLHIAQLGATSGIDRFADRSLWSVLPTGEVYFPEVRSWIRGRVLNQMDAAGSTIVLVEALEAKTSSECSTDPLVYHNRAWHRLNEHSRIVR